jgi:hypothetical protein
MNTTLNRCRPIRTLLLLCGVVVAVMAQLSRPDPLPAAGATDHCGIITGAETWDATTVHTTSCEVTVAEGATLTIAEGAIVKIARRQIIFVYGTLRVLGSEANPVYLTSIRDDSIGGDTNGDGDATSPDLSDWYGIQFAGASGNPDSLVDHAIVRYASMGTWLVTASPTVTRSTFVANSCPHHGDPSSTPTLLYNRYENNFYNGYCIGDGEITGSVTWSNVGTTYVILGDVSVAPGGQLSLAPGLVVKFIFRGLPVYGTLIAEGTQLQPIYFTALADDSVGGDTNNNGDGSQPVPYSWPGLFLAPSGDAPPSRFAHASIRWAGASNGAGLYLSGAAPAIRYSTFSDNAVAIRADSSTPTLTCNNIAGNVTYGLENLTPATVITAENQWWGDVTGPGGAGPGSGDPVSEGVDFTPWATAPCIETTIQRLFLPGIMK